MSENGRDIKPGQTDYVAYLRVHSRAFWRGGRGAVSDARALREGERVADDTLRTFSYSPRLLLYRCAISGTSGSSGLGSVSREQMESSTLLMVSAGLLATRG